MRATGVALPLLALVAAGCSLAGDITPPPAVATAQAAETLPPVAAVTTEPSLAETSPPPTLAAPTSAVASDAAGINLALGESIWMEECAACHGEAGQSDGAATASLTRAPPKLGDPQIARDARPADWSAVVAGGGVDRLMPSFAGLSDAERWSVIAYALTLGTGAEAQARGDELYAAEGCAACHEDKRGGAGGGPSFQISGGVEQRSLSDLALSIGEGIPPAMPAYGDRLTEDDVWSLAAYVRSIAWGSLQVDASAGAPSEETLALAGTVRGVVTNSTTGGTLPSDLEAVLSGFDGEEETYRQSARVAADGTYTFSDVPVVAGRVYGVTVVYDGVPYYSDGTHLTEDGTAADLPVSVYEVTADSAALSIERLHVLFDFAVPDQVQVIELWILSNSGDRTIVAEPSEAIFEVSLAEGASGLAFEDGSSSDRYIQMANGFGDTAPVVPGMGTSQFIFSYWLPYDGGMTFRRPSNHPIMAVVVLLPQIGVTVQGTGLRDLGVQQMSGQAVQTYEGGAIDAGQALEIELAGHPQGESTVSGGGWANTAIGLGALAVLLLAAGLWWFRPRLGPSGNEDSTERLLSAVAELDDALQAGRIDPDVHQARREALKRQLRERMRRP